MKKARLILNAVVFCLVIAFFSGAFLILPDKEMSKAERRPLKQFEEVTDGDKHPFEEIEDYLLDQFPMRDTFRGLKTFLFVDVLKRMRITTCISMRVVWLKFRISLTKRRLNMRRI